MNKSSPHYLFDPTSPGWIIRKHKKGEYISAADVARVLEAYPDSINDPVIRDYAGKAGSGELRKPTGRRAKSIGHYARLMVAGELAKEKMAAWREARRRRSPDAPATGRGEPSLFELAYEEAAREMRLNKSGRSLMNDLSRMKKAHPIFCA